MNEDITEKMITKVELQKSERFFQSILMSIHDHIAVLDRHGVILTVNKSWIDFASENNVNSIDLISPGQNYLDICRRAVMDSDDDLAR